MPDDPAPPSPAVSSLDGKQQIEQLSKEREAALAALRLRIEFVRDQAYQLAVAGGASGGAGGAMGADGAEAGDEDEDDYVPFVG